MITLSLLFLAAMNYEVNGHGRFMKPPNRSSIWRVRKFSNQSPPRNYEDDALFCGGVRQREIVGGNCGVCGDPFNQSVPRDNEIHGKWYRGIITGRYNTGSTIDVEVQLTVDHLGFMEWRLCTTPSAGETQECFNKYLLQRSDGQGSGLNATRRKRGYYSTQLRLPNGVTCEHCVIQWNYRAGNLLFQTGFTDVTEKFVETDDSWQELIKHNIKDGSRE